MFFMLEADFEILVECAKTPGSKVNTWAMQGLKHVMDANYESPKLQPLS